MQSAKTSVVKPKNSLAVHEFVYGLEKRLVCRVKEFENFVKLRMNPELTKFLLLAAMGERKQLKSALQDRVSVEDIVLSVLSEVFSLNAEEKEQVKSQIDFLVDNKLVTSASFLEKLVAGLRAICKTI